jgi:hypothetical protein
MSTPSHELIVCRSQPSRRTGMNKRDATATRALAANVARAAERPCSMGLSARADGGTRTPDPIITSASDVSMVGVPGDPIAVTSADLGSGRDGAGQAKRPKNAPRKARDSACRHRVGLAEEEAAGASRFGRAAGDPRNRRHLSAPPTRGSESRITLPPGACSSSAASVRGLNSATFACRGERGSAPLLRGMTVAVS